MSRDPIYRQMEATRERLTLESKRMTTESANRDQLMFRIRRTIANLERVPRIRIAYAALERDAAARSA